LGEFTKLNARLGTRRTAAKGDIVESSIVLKTTILPSVAVVMSMDFESTEKKATQLF
jgi:hypothetical protein